MNHPGSTAIGKQIVLFGSKQVYSGDFYRDKVKAADAPPNPPRMMGVNCDFLFVFSIETRKRSTLTLSCLCQMYLQGKTFR